MSVRNRTLILAALIALLAIAGEWSGVGGAARFWCLPAALLLLAIAYDGWVARRAGLSLKVLAPARWLLARPVPVALEISHGGPRVLELELAPDAPAAVACSRAIRALSVPPGHTVLVDLTAVPRRLGSLEWPALRARIAGPLRLAWWTLPLGDAKAVRVVPDLLGREGAVTGVARAGERATARRGSGGEVLHLRAYQPGDSFRTIDWKASARLGRLTSRDFAEDQHLEIVIAIDVGRSSAIACGDLDRLGHYVNLAARLAERATAQDDRVGLVVFGDRPLAALAPGRGTAAVSRIRALLASLEAQRGDSNPIHAAARIRTLVRRRCLVILLTEIDDAATGSQLLGAVRLLRPLHLPMVVGVRSAALDAFASEPAHDWLDPFRTLAGEENRRRVGRNAAALRALGVVALSPRPEHLEHEVFEAYARFRRERRV